MPLTGSTTDTDSQIPMTATAMTGRCSRASGAWRVLTAEHQGQRDQDQHHGAHDHQLIGRHPEQGRQLVDRGGQHQDAVLIT